MAMKAKTESTTSKGKRAGPVLMAEALERLLPYCDGSPHQVAARLDKQHREGDVGLLGGGTAMAPAANPALLGVVAHIPPVGEAFLYVQVRQNLGMHCPIWDGTVTSLEQHHDFWAFERTSFENHFPNTATPKNRGGRPAEYSVEDLVTEALVYVVVAGALPKTVEGEGGLYEKLRDRLRSRCPAPTRLREIFGPIYQRIENERLASRKSR
jgi:hypothetical protein